MAGTRRREHKLAHAVLLFSSSSTAAAEQTEHRIVLKKKYIKYTSAASYRRQADVKGMCTYFQCDTIRLKKFVAASIH